MLRKQVWIMALAFWATAGLAWGKGLKAGVAQVDITPPPGLPMYGYLDRPQLSSGTLDPLYARILVVEVEGKRLALITLDLGQAFGPTSLARLRKKLSEQSGIAYFFITASHTHAGPNMLDVYPGNQTPAWEIAALDKIAGGVQEACQHEVEAQLGTGFGSVSVAHNRRRVNADGSVTMVYQNPDKVPILPVDPTVSLLRVDTQDGKPLAILVNYSCHPVVFGPDNLQYSADYVGVMARTVEQSVGAASGARPLCFFLQGGDGDINPYYATTPLADGAQKLRDWTGQQLGIEAARVALAIHTEPVETPTLQCAEDSMKIPVRWDPQKFRRGMLATYGPKVYEDHAEQLNSDSAPTELTLTVTTVLLNKKIALLGMPGEPFVDFQMDWRKRCPLKSSFFVGYTNGYFDYFPTVQAAAQGGYGAGDSNTYLAVGAGESMLNQGLTRIFQMLGRLRDVPEDLTKP